MRSSLLDSSRLDPAAMGVPDVSSVRLATMAEELRESAVRVAAAVEQVVRGVGAALCWEGSAAAAFEGWVTDFDARVAQAVMVAAASASAVRDCADEVAACERAVVALRDQLGNIVARNGDMSGVPLDAGVVSDALAMEVAALWDAHARVMRRAWAAEAAADRAVQTATAQVPGRPRSIMEQLNDAGAGFVRGAVIEPVAGVWRLSGQALYDRQGWRANVDAAVSGWLAAGRGLWAHPVTGAAEMVKQEVGWSEWAGGSYGAGVGAVAVAAAPLGRVRRVADAPQVTPRRGYSGPGGSQSFEDMLDLVDLAAHEDVGHTLARHVDVTDEDLVARVTIGVDFGDGKVNQSDTASRFTDRDTAELAITAALNANRAEILRLIAAGDIVTGDWKTVRFDTSEPIGFLVQRNNPGVIVPVTSVAVKIGLDSDTQRLFIGTAWPDVRES